MPPAKAPPPDAATPAGDTASGGAPALRTGAAPRTVPAKNTPAINSPARSATGPKPVPDRLPPGTPPPAVAKRLAAIAARPVGYAGADAAPEPPTAPIAFGGSPPPFRTEADVPRDTRDIGAAPPGKVMAARKTVAPPPRELGATLTQSAPVNEVASAAKPASYGGLGGLFASRRAASAKLDTTAAKVAAPPAAVLAKQPPVKGAARAPGPGVQGTASMGTAPPDAAPISGNRKDVDRRASQNERDSMTVFGARRQAKAAARPGKPRFLLAILIAALIAVLAGVAAWAAVFPESRVAAWLGMEPEVQIAAAPEPAPVQDGAPSGADVGGAAETGSADTDIVVPLETGPDAPDIAAALAAPGAETAPGQPADAAGPVTADAAPALPEQVGPDARPLAQTDPPAPTPLPEPERVAVIPARGVASGAVPTPAEADRFYAATGVWLRAPRLPLRPEAEVLSGVSPTTLPEPTTIADRPVLAAIAPDGRVPDQRNPPGADVEFPRDARGFLLATADGIVTPGGMVIYAAAPPVIPPTRPGTPAPPAPTPTVTVTDNGFPNALATMPGRPALRPAAFADLFGPLSIDDAATAATQPLPDAPPDAPDAEAGSAEDTGAGIVEDIASVPSALPGGVSLDGLRPPGRPEDLSAAPAPDVLVAFAGPRPPVRSQDPAPADTTIDTTVEDAVEDALEAPPVENTVSSALAAIVAAGPDPLATATRLAVASAPRPDPRPRNFSQVVANSQTRTRTATAAAAPAPTPAAPPAAAAGIPRSADDDGEPEPASGAAAAPTGPTARTVAAAATQESVIDLGRVNLIGVYGRPNNRSALIRLSNGRYIRVGIGDSLEGGQVTAIGDNALNYVVRGQLYALVIPEE